MRRSSILLAAMLIAAGCRDEAATSPATTPASTPATSPLVGTASPASSTAAGPAPVHVTDLADGVRRFGDGRAELAAYDPAADRTVVATTIGLFVQTGDGDATVLLPERATLLAMSPAGSRVAAITAGGTLGIWDLASGQVLATFPVGGDVFTALAFTDDSVVVAGGEAEMAWFAADGTSGSVVAAGDGSTLGPPALDGAGTVYVPLLAPAPSVAAWSPGGGRHDIDLGLGPGSRLTGVAASADGAHLAILDAPADAGDEVAIWDVAAERLVARIALPNFVAPDQVAFPAPDRLVVPNLDRVVGYDLAGTEIGAFPVGPSAVSEIHAVGGAAIVSRLDGTVTRWILGGEPADLGARTVALVDQRGGEAMTVVDQDGLVRSYGRDGAEQRRLDRWAVGRATAVDLAADGRSMVISTSTGAVRLLDMPSGAVSDVLDRSQGDVSDVSFAPDVRLLATGVSVQMRSEAWDDTVEVTDLASDTAAFSLGGQAEDVAGCSFYLAHVVFSPDGTMLASTSHDFTVQVTPLDDPDATAVLEPHLGTVLDVAFSPDGTQLVTSADDGTMRVWNVADWTLRDEYGTAAGGWYSMAFSPDGTALAVSDLAGQISLLDTSTGAVERTFSDTRATLGDMAFTPDGRRLLAPQPDGAVAVWDLATGAVTQRLSGHTLPVTSIAVAHDGRAVATASDDGTVRYWPLPAS